MSGVSDAGQNEDRRSTAQRLIDANPGRPEELKPRCKIGLPSIVKARGIAPIVASRE